MRSSSLRRDVEDLVRGSAARVWVTGSLESHLGVEESAGVGLRLRRVRESDLVVCVLETGASRVRGEHSGVWVSQMELDLLRAALCRKPIHVLTAEGFLPDPYLRDLMQALEIALPGTATVERLPERQLLATARRLVGSAGSRGAPGRRVWSRVYPRLLVSLGLRRCRVLHPGLGRDLQFCSGAFPASREQRPDVLRIEQMLAREREASREDDRISRLWVAVRELLAAPYGDSTEVELLPLWDKTLGRWVGAASWYGLHGFFDLSVLAAHNSRAAIRRRMRASGRYHREQDVRHPAGGLANAYYSIAISYPNWRGRRKLLHEAQRQVQLAIDSRDGEATGLLQMRGSIHLRLGRFNDAVDDYEAGLRSIPEGDEIGGALSELGFGYLFVGKLRRGLEYLESGVRQLEENRRGRPGFLVRAKKKLAIANLLNGRALRAKTMWKDALLLARKADVLDQD